MTDQTNHEAAQGPELTPTPSQEADVATYLEFIRNNDEEGSVAYLKGFFEGNDEVLKEFVDKVMVIAQAEGKATESPVEEGAQRAPETPDETDTSA